MSTQPVKPLIRLTMEQWRELVRRLLQKRGTLTREGVEELMGVEPPVTREMGTLIKEIPTGTGEFRRVIERLPIEEARARYFASPERYSYPWLTEPPVREAAALPPPTGPLGPEEWAKRLAYERLQFKPIIPPSIQRSIQGIKRGIEEEGKETLLRRAGITKEDIRPGVKPEVVLEEKGIRPKVEEAPISMIVRISRAADLIWKEMGGARSSAGKLWEEFLKASRGSVRKHFSTGKEYFISSFYRWYTDPKKFSKAHPREAKILEEIRRDPQYSDIFVFIEAEVK